VPEPKYDTEILVMTPSARTNIRYWNLSDDTQRPNQHTILKS